MKILLINLHSLHNVGDAALTFQTIRLLEARFPGAALTFSMNQLGDLSRFGKVVGSLTYWCKTAETGQPSRWLARGLLCFIPASLLALVSFRLFHRRVFVFLSPAQRESLNAYFDADLVVSKPGGFLYSHGAIGLPLILAAYSIAYATILGKPHYMLPQSIGPFVRSFDRWLVRSVLNQTRLTMLRETISVREMEALHVAPSRFSQVPDVAFAFPSAPVPEALAWLSRNAIDVDASRPLLGVTAINWGAQTAGFPWQVQYERALAAALALFIEQHDATVIIFPQVTGPSAAEDDRVAARRIRDLVSVAQARVFVIEQSVEPALMKAAYGLMDLFIGTRMHSNIFSVAGGVPTLAIGYQPKTRGIMRQLGLEDWVLEMDQCTTDRLTERIESLWQKRAAVRQHISAVLPALLACIEHCLDAIPEPAA